MNRACFGRIVKAVKFGGSVGLPMSQEDVAGGETPRESD